MTVYIKDNPEYFSLALMSMVNQTKKPDEIVLVKDGPITNELQKVIDNVDRNYPELIVQVQLPNNKGLGFALNEGIKVCKNELLARMDSDDISMPTRCEKQVAEFEKNPKLDIVGCPVIEFVGEPDNEVGKRNVPLDNEAIYKYCRKRDPFNHPTVMYRKSKVEEAGCYGNLRKNQDTDLWIKMLTKGAVCENLSEYLLKFRFDEVTNKQDEAANKQDENVSKLDEIIYPMYLPTGTTFKGEETVKTDDSERVILSFTGDKSFIMIEEVSKVPGEFEVSNTDGELVFYENILGSLTDTSLNWTANGKDYYIIAENLSNEELLKVASSTGTVSLTKTIKTPD